jgi:8-oxo-dGTP pyrophosphatase MutT (NUDIX family)
MKGIREGEIRMLEDRYGKARKVELQVERNPFGKEREEVVLVIPGEKGIFLLSKDYYPPGTYRLPTGKIEPGEGIEETVIREGLEETGFYPHISKFLGILTLGFSIPPSRSISYFFLLLPLPGHPRPADRNERISDFIEIPLEDLPKVAEKLRALEGPWHEWGLFRAMAVDFASSLLKDG